MTLIISVFGVFIAGAGIWGFIAPKPMVKSVLKVWNQPWGIYLAIAVRIGLGVVFIVAANETRYPGFFNFFGYLMIIAAVLIAIIGRQRLDRFIRWWVDASPIVTRLWLLLATAFGAFLVYAVN
jgi:hypothetical protein